MQSRLHDPNGWPGNCYAACIASLLEVELDEVPWPSKDNFDTWDSYWPRVGVYLLDRGFTLVYVPMVEEGEGVVPHRHFWHPLMALDEEHEGPLYIAGGLGPRGRNHAVVMRDGELVHDPHPDGGGLVSLSSIEILVALENPR